MVQRWGSAVLQSIQRCSFRTEHMSPPRGAAVALAGSVVVVRSRSVLTVLVTGRTARGLGGRLMALMVPGAVGCSPLDAGGVERALG